MVEDRFLKRLRKKARKGLQGWPIATVAFYGPNLSQATKVAVGACHDEALCGSLNLEADASTGFHRSRRGSGVRPSIPGRHRPRGRSAWRRPRRGDHG